MNESILEYMLKHERENDTYNRMLIRERVYKDFREMVALRILRLHKYDYELDTWAIY
jgi:hypothetical protein